MTFKFTNTVLITFILFGLSFWNSAQSAQIRSLQSKVGFKMKTVEKGRYLLKIAGCNDCHTAGYLPSEGSTSDHLWLTGDTFGWNGPWGTTYGTNLRLLISGLTEKEWIEFATTLKSLPPMPWFNLNAMTHNDLRAVYQFIRYLGPSGKPVPNYLPAGKEPTGAYAIFPPPPK